MSKLCHQGAFKLHRVGVGMRKRCVIEDDPTILVGFDLLRQSGEKLGLVAGVVDTRRSMETKVSQGEVSAGNGCFGGCLRRISGYARDRVLPKESICFGGEP